MYSIWSVCLAAKISAIDPSLDHDMSVGRAGDVPAASADRARLVPKTAASIDIA